MIINLVQLGRMDYVTALAIQEKLMKLRQQREVRDTLLLLEHPPVLTIGKSGKNSNILVLKEVLVREGVSIYEATRGGDVTYHGPGQIVGYPILDLNRYGRDVREFVTKIKEVFIRLLWHEYGIEATGENAIHTGVWVGDDKITAIGLTIKRWVTMHGFAFNVNTNLEHFRWINPCGITDRGVTSLQKVLGRPLDLDVVNNQVADYFCQVFGVEAEHKGKEWIEQVKLG